MPDQTATSIFLGAGASAEFQIPTAARMAREFQVANPHFSRLLGQINRNLQGLGFQRNIENVLSYARGLRNPRQSLSQSTPFVSRFVSRTSLATNPRLRTTAGELVKAIEDYIADTCAVNEEYRIAEIRDLYSKFARHIIRRFHVPFRRIGTLRVPNIDIFTTNYDNVVESFCDEVGSDLFFDGYDTSAGDPRRNVPQVGSFVPDQYQARGPIRLHKLHGSVTHGLLEDGHTVVSEGGTRVGDNVGSFGRIVSRVMIHGFEKQHGQEPYFDQHYMLKENLRRAMTCVVVGYSFPDDVIRRIFLDVIRSRGSELTVLLLNPNATGIRRQVFRNSPSVRAIGGRFSDYNRL